MKYKFSLDKGHFITGGDTSDAAAKWLTSRFLSIATILYGSITTLIMIMVMIQADHVSDKFRDLDFEGMKTLIQMFPIIFWITLIVVIALLSLSIYRYIQAQNEKINLLYAVSYGIEGYLIFNLKDLKDLASSINRESIVDLMHYGASAYANLNNLKMTAVYLLFMSLFICFAGFAAIMRRKA